MYQTWPERCAKWSWQFPLLAVAIFALRAMALGIADQSSDPSDSPISPAIDTAVCCFAILLFMAGTIFTVYALGSIPWYGASGILLHALIGLVINGFMHWEGTIPAVRVAIKTHQSSSQHSPSEIDLTC